MIELKIILASTRPGRKGAAVASWFLDIARKHSEFHIELIDLLEVNLPFLDEPAHPRFKTYEKEHTKSWSRRIEAADAFVAVTAEYNYGYPASLKNAIDFLHQEWLYKPIGFVSYGGLAGGTRSVQMLKQVVTSLKMMPLMESVNIPFFSQYIDQSGVFRPPQNFEKSADEMLEELARWAATLKAMREGRNR